MNLTERIGRAERIELFDHHQANHAERPSRGCRYCDLRREAEDRPRPRWLERAGKDLTGAIRA